VALGFDPYAVLGLSRDATAAQIAQARRQLSRQFHPDVNSAPDAAPPGRTAG
jgi:molecular chaperone DnaJ